MILVTVGMQLAFDRLIEAMDAIASELDQTVIAQTGNGTFVPQNMRAHQKIAPQEFEALVARCNLIVSHAGIGTVLTAARYSKPVVLMPRRADLGEHRNDHQLATAANLGNRPGILIAAAETVLHQRVLEGLALGTVSPRKSPEANALKRAVTQFIATGTL